MTGFTISATVPVLATAAIGNYRNPTLCMSWTQNLDSTGLFIESVDQTTNIMAVTATATQTLSSSDQTSPTQKGVNLFINITSVAATTTLRFNIQAKDPFSGNYGTVLTASLDAQATNATSFSVLQLYPGVTGVSLAAGGFGAASSYLSRTWRLITSITATASQGGAGVSFTVGVCKLY
jgi:hypothetical protein